MRDHFADDLRRLSVEWAKFEKVLDLPLKKVESPEEYYALGRFNDRLILTIGDDLDHPLRGLLQILQLLLSEFIGRYPKALEVTQAVSYRMFVVDGTNVTPIGLSTFEQFTRGRGRLAQFAGQIINIAILGYTLKDWLPDDEVSWQAVRVKVKPDGFIDKHYDATTAADVAEVLDQDTEMPVKGNIVDATDLLRRKRMIDAALPAISEKAQEAIRKLVFDP